MIHHAREARAADIDTIVATSWSDLPEDVQHTIIQYASTGASSSDSCQQLRFVCRHWNLLYCRSRSQLVVPKHRYHHWHHHCLTDIVSKFDSLRTLDICIREHSAQLTSIGRLTTLRSLTVHEWIAHDEGITAITRLTKLSALGCISCDVTCDHLKQLLPLSGTLRQLSLNASRALVAPYSATLSGFSALSHLDLGNMIFRDDQMVAAFGLPGLRNLCLSCCCEGDIRGLADAITSPSQCWSKLTSLSLDNWTNDSYWMAISLTLPVLAELKQLALFNYSEPAELSGHGLIFQAIALTTLTRLELNSCRLNSHETTELSNSLSLKELRVTDVERFDVKRTMNPVVAAQPPLTSLELMNFHKVSANDVQALAGNWPRLTSLKIHHSRLHPGSLSALSTLTALTSLFLGDTMFSRGGTKYWMNCDLMQLFNLHYLVCLELPSKLQCSSKALHSLLRLLPSLRTLKIANLFDTMVLQNKFRCLSVVTNSDVDSSSEED